MINKEDILKEGSKQEDCGSYCSHGGYCIKGKGHEGNHYSGYCVWNDGDGLTKEEADKVFLPKLNKMFGEEENGN